MIIECKIKTEYGYNIDTDGFDIDFCYEEGYSVYTVIYCPICGKQLTIEEMRGR